MQLRRIAGACAALGLAFPLAACVPPQTGNVVDAGQVQVAQNVTLGTILGATPVAVRGANPGGELAGTAGGAALGGAIGNQIGDGEGRDIARAIGVIAGGVAGNRAAGNATVQQSLEWTVRLDNGRTISVIQSEPTFARGQRVQVIQGAGGLTRLAAI